MVFVACGLNHKTAPLELREKIAFQPAMLESLLDDLKQLAGMHEAVLLSTCNRTEIYCETEDPISVSKWLLHQHQIPELSHSLYLYQEENAFRHALRVASGLDSMMLGEPQILGQMKQAYQMACVLGNSRNKLRNIFDYIFSASKRIRHHSGINNNPVSVAYAAVQLIKNQFSTLNNLKVFLIGSGETATLVAKYLYKMGVKDFLVASRSPENAQSLASIFQGQPVNITEIPKYLPEADVVISATTCPLPFIDKNMVLKALEARNNAPLFLLDLAVPRDIEAEVQTLEHVRLYNIDNLQNLTKKGMKERQQAAVQAEILLEKELNNYLRWHRSKQARSLICNYRDFMQTLANQEVERALQKLNNGQCERTVFDEFSKRLINKLTHLPSTKLSQMAADGHQELFELAEYFFNSISRSTYEKIP